MTKEPFWKRLLSYAFEWHIESSSSQYNPHLYVSLKKGRYQLSTAHAVYSYADLYNNFGDTFKAIDWDQWPVEKVLVLGLGLGSIPLMLEDHLGPDFHCTAVEIDEAVIGLASTYGLPAIQVPLDIVCADALAFVNQSEEQFDLICMDIFLDDTVPEVFEQTHFLQLLRDRLTSKGILLFNRLAATWYDTRATEKFFKEQFLPVFPDGDYLQLKSNWMLVNEKDLFSSSR